jgi:T5SS/PEP-CTERM-associated repeat protein
MKLMLLDSASSSDLRWQTGVLGEASRVRDAAKLGSRKAPWLAALGFALLAAQELAGTTLIDRLSDATASACVVDSQLVFQCDSPPAKMQTDFLPANLSNTATITVEGKTPTATSTSTSSINLDSVTGILEVTGEGMATGNLDPVFSPGATATASAKVISLTFVTDVPCSYTMTGHLAASQLHFNIQAIARLTGGPTGEVFTAFSTSGETAIDESGTFPPGTYTLTVTVSAEGTTSVMVPATASTDFFFSAVPMGAPTPTPSPGIQWKNTAGGSFHTATNWDPQMVPGTSDTAVFGLASAYSVDVGTATTERLEIRNGDVTFTNANYNVAALDFVPSGTVLDNAVLTLASGTLSGIHALIGESAAARVDVNSGATLNYTGSLQVGGAGHGNLFINDGGFVFSGEGRIGTGVGGGEAEVEGPAALWDSGSLAVGFFSGVESSLFVSGGATLLSDSGSVGFSPGSDGFVEIDGDLSTWTLAGDLKIGEGGVGNLNVLNGALVTCDALRLGISAPGTALVKGAGAEPSLVDVAATLFVGQDNPGILVIENGAQVRATTDIFIGFGAVGSVIVTGKSAAGPSRLNSLGHLAVGLFDVPGFLTIEEDATVISDEGIVSFGELVLGVDNAPGNPASWSVSNLLQIAGTGRVELHNGAIVTVGQTLTVDRAGLICGNGTYSVMGVENNGTVCPGNSPGTLVIEGDYTQTATGKLTIETAGLGDGEFDLLHVTGDATLDGTLEMLFPGAYLPKTGDSWKFLEVDGTISGEFAEVTFPQLLPGFQFDLMQVPGGFLFTALNDAVLAPTFLLNISTRLQVGTDDNVLIGGFILQGTEPKKVLIRAVGPSLEAAGVSGALADPTLELHDSTGAVIGQNDNWRTTQIGGLITEDQFLEIFSTGIPPTSTAESAILATLDPGAYTAILAGANSSTGIGLVEVYDLGPAAAPAKLANISTRGFVQTGDNIMIGGFIIGNQTSQVLVRGIGPSLAAVGVSGALADPMLDLYDVNGALLASNDNWRSDQEAEIEATTIPPNDDLESAILRTLAPGAYTAILRGVSGGTGVGLVEAYNLD